ncbi:tetratricopeptide repeat protein [Flavobacterium qiangtangense]|uniref:Tetratricopeptide repeat protein n=1 Tax=Flavobacterium qiangtangense TaxID=1442595 RepID=A0ABW1PS74_9FLAO
MKKLLLLVLFSQLASCQNKPDIKAVELLKKANEIGAKSFYKDSIENNKALKLIDEAIRIDDKYFSAYQSKTIFLSAKEDIDGLLQNNLEIIELRPNQPIWRIQRGLFLEIKGNKIKAQESYKLGLSKYQEILKQKDMNQDFNFRIEYISALEANENLNQAKVEMEKLRNDFPGNEIVQNYVKEYKLKTKAELISLWKNGE